MRNYTIIALAMLMAIAGMASGQNFIQGEAKGSDAPGAMLIGAGDQSEEVAITMSRGILDLSNVSPSIFDSPMFKKDGWVSDGGSYGRTPSQTAFINDKSGENLRYSPKQGDW